MAFVAFTPSVSTAVSVGLAATQIVAANASRRKIIISNDSANPLFIGKDNTVSSANGASKGLVIPSNTWREVTWQTTIFGIYGTGSNFVSYVEET